MILYTLRKRLGCPCFIFSVSMYIVTMFVNMIIRHNKWLCVLTYDIDIYDETTLSLMKIVNKVWCQLCITYWKHQLLYRFQSLNLTFQLRLSPRLHESRKTIFHLCSSCLFIFNISFIEFRSWHRCFPNNAWPCSYRMVCNKNKTNINTNIFL